MQQAVRRSAVETNFNAIHKALKAPGSYSKVLSVARFVMVSRLVPLS